MFFKAGVLINFLIFTGKHVCRFLKFVKYLFTNIQKQQNTLKSSLFLTKIQSLRMNHSRIISIRNAKFSGYYFCMNQNMKVDFQICNSVPLITNNVGWVLLERFVDLLNVCFNDMQINIWLYLSSSHFGISFLQEHMTEYIVLDIQFWSLNYMLFAKIAKISNKTIFDEKFHVVFKHFENLIWNFLKKKLHILWLKGSFSRKACAAFRMPHCKQSRLGEAATGGVL